MSSISSSPSRRPSPTEHDGKAEAALAFFQGKTADYLAGLLDRHWKNYVLRAAEQNDAIYHAVLAIGSMHKSIMTKNPPSIDGGSEVYAVKQYTRSLRLLASGESATIDVMLAACILFVGFEVGDVLIHVEIPLTSYCRVCVEILGSLWSTFEMAFELCSNTRLECQTTMNRV